MILEGQKKIEPRLTIPKTLKDKIKVFTNCTLARNEVLEFQLVLQAIAKHIELDAIDLSTYYKLNVIFTESGKILFMKRIL